jgi:hypothetical protein
MSDVSATGMGSSRSKPARPTKRQRAAAKAAAAHEPAPTFETNGTSHAAEAGAAAPMSGEIIEPVSDDGTPLEAERVGVRMSAIGRVTTSDLTVEQGAVGAARAEHLSVERGAVGAAMADNVELSRGYARSILARQVQLDRAAARIVIAADVRANQSAAMFLVARKVDGNIKVLFDWRGAIAFGAVAGLVFAMLSRIRNPRGGRTRGKKEKS